MIAVSMLFRLFLLARWLQEGDAGAEYRPDGMHGSAVRRCYRHEAKAPPAIPPEKLIPARRCTRRSWRQPAAIDSSLADATGAAVAQPPTRRLTIASSPRRANTAGHSLLSASSCHGAVARPGWQSKTAALRQAVGDSRKTSRLTNAGWRASSR